MAKTVYFVMEGDRRHREVANDRLKIEGTERIAYVGAALKEELSDKVGDSTVNIYYSSKNISKQSAEVLAAILKPLRVQLEARHFRKPDSLQVVVDEIADLGVIVSRRKTINFYLRRLGLPGGKQSQYYKLEIPQDTY